MLTQGGQEATEPGSKTLPARSWVNPAHIWFGFRLKHTIDALEDQVQQQDDDNPTGFEAPSPVRSPELTARSHCCWGAIKAAFKANGKHQLRQRQEETFVVLESSFDTLFNRMQTWITYFN